MCTVHHQNKYILTISVHAVVGLFFCISLCFHCLGGYAVNRDLFMRYVTPITLYACIGTLICTAVVACILYGASSTFGFEVTFLELAAFGALVSATDPVSTLAVFSAKRVDPHLFYLVFGESMINDAVGLVLFESLAHLVERNMEAAEPLSVGAEMLQFVIDFFVVIAGSLFLGTLVGLAYAAFYKYVDMRHTPLLELCSYMTILYLPFVLAECMRLSGIVTTLVAGFAARRYVVPNLSADTAMTSDRVFRLTAHVTETMIFMEIGLSVTSGLSGGFHLWFFALALVACTVGRACNVPITIFYNALLAPKSSSSSNYNNTTQTIRTLPIEMDSVRTTTDTEYTLQKEDGEEGHHPADVGKKSISDTYGDTLNDSQVSWAKANMMFFSGLRGAVSYALVKTFPETGNEHVFQVTTALIVLVTTFLFGGGTEIALKALNIPMNVDENEYLLAVGKKKSLPGALGRWESQTVRRWVIRDFALKEKQGLLNSAVAPTPTPGAANLASVPEGDGLYSPHIEIVGFHPNGHGIYDYGH